jgi:hypothetical protein
MKEQIDEINSGAVLITEAILYVKQHSVNCVAAAMYAMSRFDPVLFPPDEADVFAARLFGKPDGLAPADAVIIRDHISALYRRFMADIRSPDEPWEMPLLRFLQTYNMP